MLYIGLSDLRKSKDEDGALEKMYTISSNFLDIPIYRKKQYPMKVTTYVYTLIKRQLREVTIVYANKTTMA